MKLVIASCRRVVLPLAFSCALLGAQGVAAQPATDGARATTVAQLSTLNLPDTVVTATRTAQPLSDVLAEVTLIDRPQIEASGAVNIADLLARQPGLELSRSGGPGTATGVFMRGGETRFTAVYIDGVRVDSQATGGAPWEVIALAQVERIEIVRGAAAAIYGSDAISGVIQIFTRQGDGPFTPYAGVGAGTRRTGKLEAGFYGKSGAVDYSLGVGRDLSRGYNSMPAMNPDRDGYRQSTASGRLGWQVDPAHRLDLTGTWTSMDAQYDGFLPGLDDHSLNRLGTLGATWSAHWSPNYSTRLSVNESRQHNELPTAFYQTTTRLRNTLLHNEWRQGNHRFTAALERREDRLANDDSFSPVIDRSRHQDALALGWGYTGDAHTLQLNLRRDRDSEFGGKTTGGLAWGYRFAPGWRVSAAAGTAFRVPTLYQRFSEYGQAGLQPESSRNIELGLHWQQDASRFDITAYRNRVRNLIVFGAAGPCLSPWGCFENAGRARLQGVTITGAHRLGGVNLSASLDLQQPRNVGTGKLLPRRAQRQFKLAADTRVAGWTLGAEWQAVGRRWDDAANTVRLGGHGLVNLYAKTTIARQWDLLARVDNLNGKTYQLASGYATPPRSLFVGLRWTGR